MGGGGPTPKYVCRFVKGGRTYVYYRRFGRRTRLPEAPFDSAEFLEAYTAVHEMHELSKEIRVPARSSVPPILRSAANPSRGYSMTPIAPLLAELGKGLPTFEAKFWARLDRAAGGC